MASQPLIPPTQTKDMDMTFCICILHPQSISLNCFTKNIKSAPKLNRSTCANKILQVQTSVLSKRGFQLVIIIWDSVYKCEPINIYGLTGVAKYYQVMIDNFFGPAYEGHLFDHLLWSIFPIEFFCQGFSPRIYYCSIFFYS